MKSRFFEAVINRIQDFPCPLEEDDLLTEKECMKLYRVIYSTWPNRQNVKELKGQYRAEVSDSGKIENPDETKKWMEALPFSGRVYLIDGFMCDGGVILDYHTFVRFFEDFWDPFHSDLWVFDFDKQYHLEIQHDCMQLTFYALNIPDND